MTRLLNDKLDSIFPNKFYTFGPLISLSSDLIFIYYAVYVMLPMTLTPSYFSQVSKMVYGQEIILNPDSIEMLSAMTQTSLLIVFMGFFIFNMVVAYNVHRKNKLSIKYLKGYTGSTVLLSIVEMGVYAVKLHQFNFYTFFTTLLYGIVFTGLWHLTQKPVPQT